MNKMGYTDCPSCGDLISENARACACGWKSSKKEQKLQNRNCSYSNNGINCPLLATIFANRGDKGTCRHHDGWWDNPRLAALNLDEILSGKIKQSGEWREEEIINFQNKHPEFKVVPKSREDVEDMIEMTQKFIKRNNLPYDKKRTIA